MKQILSAFLVLLSFGASSQFYPVGESEVDPPRHHAASKKMVVKPFSISALITVSEFKTYLASVQKDSSASFYNAQLATSYQMRKDLLQAILKDVSLQNKPMPGVSWTVARNYCKWLTAKAQKEGLPYTFELPLLSEMIAFDAVYHPDPELETWTLTSYDESLMVDFPEYLYFAMDSDPPVMKRKAIYGGSFHMNYTNEIGEKLSHYLYQDSCSRYIGFRVVRSSPNVKRHMEIRAQRRTMTIGGDKTSSEKNVVETKEAVVKSETEQSVTIDGRKTTFGTDRNHLHGVYEEHYANGNRRVLGEFYHNQRTGIWSIWDSTGKLLIRRNYTTNRTCNFVFPEVNNPYENIYATHPTYSPQRNESDFYPYERVFERAVSYSHRSMRQLTRDNEFYLFELVIFDKLVKSIIDSDTKWFAYGNNANFARVITGDSLAVLKNSYNSWDFSRVEIKEDFFYNLDEMTSDTRALALSFYKNKEDSMPTYSLYVPHIRKQLAAVKLTYPGFPQIKNLDDVLFYHVYRGQINWRSNVFDRDRKAVNDWEEEILRLNGEHGQWLQFGR